jgi:hypothetical protein
VKKLIATLFGNEQWVDAGQKWQGLDTQLQLSGWSRKRRLVVLRRPLREGVAEEKNSKKKAAKQLTLDLPETTHQGVLYEYAVLVTSLPDEIRTIAQHYRDRGDSENNFDELKNQWGWAGFTTHDRKRCQVMARITALILQLVDDLHAVGHSGEARRGDHLASAGTAWDSSADPARQSNHGRGHQHACQSAGDRRCAGQSQRVPQTNQGHCGAINSTGTVEADSQRCLSTISPREGAWRHWPRGRRYRLNAVFRIQGQSVFKDR